MTNLPSPSQPAGKPSWRMSWMALQGHLMARRGALGLRQEDVCERLGVSRSTFQRWETGRAVPNGYELFRWADLLGIVISSAVHAESVNSDASQKAA